MFPSENLRSRKRKGSCIESSPELSHPVKKSKTAVEVEPTCDHRPARFWDTLSKIRLSQGAVREFERRKSGIAQRQQRSRPAGLLTSEVEIPRQLARFSRHGGPNLTYLRGFAASATVDMSGRKRSSASGHGKVSSKASSPYDGDFEQKLIDGGIYPEGHEHPGNASSFEPTNIEEIQRALRAPRPSLSPSRFSDGAYREFKRLSARPAKEAGVMADILPIIAGEGRKKYHSMTDAQFTNISPIVEDITAPTPDIYDGAPPEQINLDVRRKLGSYIVPSKETYYPAAPNFFLEGKSTKGRADIAKRQACHDGAIGARAIHKLQNYGARRPTYDGNAYSFSSTYHDGQLKMYAHHPTKPGILGGRPNYHTTLIDAYAMVGNRRSFCEGAAAFRNERDLAESNRNSFIEKANQQARHTSLPSPAATLTEYQGSRSIPRDDQSDTSTDELVAEVPVQKRHRHVSSVHQTVEVSRPTTQSKSNNRHADEDERPRGYAPPSHLQSSRHTVVPKRDTSKRQPKPTQKILDSRYDRAENGPARTKIRYDLY